MADRFASPAAAGERLAATGYLTDATIDTVVYLADHLAKPVLVEGPAGVGKTELARAVATARGAEIVRLSCYEGLDEAKALYEWDYARQLLRITHARQAEGPSSWDDLEGDLFSEDYLLERPLLRALRHADGAVLLIDEIDKVDVEFEALLLEILADFQVTIPELGTVTATVPPFVVLTSNRTRELSEALRRRCLYLHLDYPDRAREREIVLSHVPEAPVELAEQIVRTVANLRGLDLRKPPSIAETIDWARTLVALAADHVDADTLAATLGVLVKLERDAATVTGQLEAIAPARKTAP
ncbi:MAG: MoxR family ATPase [Nitriliruptoraceae bacterium]